MMQVESRKQVYLLCPGVGLTARVAMSYCILLTAPECCLFVTIVEVAAPQSLEETCTAGIAPYLGLRNACERHATSYLLPDLANIGHKSSKRKDVAPISHRFRSLEFGMIPAMIMNIGFS